MVSRDAIEIFLSRARTRARAESALSIFALAAASLFVLLLLLAWLAQYTGPAAYWPVITTGVLLAVTLGALFFGALRPWLRLKTDTAVARMVGARHPPVASDLLSAVQLAPQAGKSGKVGRTPESLASNDLVHAFRGHVGTAVESLSLTQVVPFGPAYKRLLWAAAAAAVLVSTAVMSPHIVRRGLALLTRTPTLYEGASVSAEPLVADIKLTYHYPAYTGLPPRTVEGATGDIQALKGTRVSMEMRALRRTRRALIFFGADGEGPQAEVQVSGDMLRAAFTVSDNDHYRIWLSPTFGRPVRESRGHRVEAGADQAPTVEIKAASERLELPAPRPIEVGFAATDDYGLGEIDLVFRVGNSKEKRIPLEPASGKRQAQGKTLWDPSSEALVPGVQIAYRIEARDMDAVSGPKVGTSRTLLLILERPREDTDERLESQRFVLERLLGVLADRLELGERGVERTVADEWLAWQSAHEDETGQVALLAGLVDQQKREGGSSDTLLQALSGIADRLNRALRSEIGLLQKLKPLADGMRLGGKDFTALRKANEAHADTLEDVVLALDDLIGRQRLEDLAALGEQLTQAYERLKDLLSRYQNTKDEALREQLQREIQALQRRIGELAQKVAEVKARNEVGSEWQNMPDTREAMNKAQQLQDLLKKGDSESLSQALAELGDSLQSLKDMLAQNADDFTDDRFPKESRATSELSKKMSELEGDERQLAGDTGALSDELQKAMQERQQKEMADRMASVQKKMSSLRETLKQPTPKRLGEDAAANQARAQDRAEGAQKLLQRKDVAEASKEMGELAEALTPLSKQAQMRAAKEDPNGTMRRFADKMAEAQQLADEIGQELKQLSPRGSDVASEAQRQQSQQMGQRQQSIAERTRALAEQAKQNQGLPGFEQAAEGLGEVAGQMQQAMDDLQKGDATEALAKEKAAADRLAQLREGLKGEKMGRSAREQEPVRIPGADDSNAPRAWRQELLEAMKEKSPEPFRDAVRRYYEELVK